MRIASCTVLAVALTTLTAAAQSMSPCIYATNLFASARVSSDTHQNAALPYTATIQTTFEQKLADGNRIKQTLESIEARDAKGRIVRINPTSCYSDASGQPQIHAYVSVYNPDTHSSSTWDTGPGSMALTNMSQSTPGSSIDWKNIQRTPIPHDASQNANFHREDLGTQTIAGMTANGVRYTHTLPAGFAGNDLPIETVREEWVVVTSHLVLMTTEDDPRRGKTTWKVTTFTPGDPDPKLFEPPANYATSSVTSTRTIESAAPAKP